MFTSYILLYTVLYTLKTKVVEGKSFIRKCRLQTDLKNDNSRAKMLLFFYL